MNAILVLDPESPEAGRILQLLQASSYRCIPVPDTAVLERSVPDAKAVIADVRWQNEVQRLATLPVILLDSEPSIRSAVKAIKAGATDYLPWSVGKDELQAALDRSIAEHAPPSTAVPMIGVSDPMQALFDTIFKIAPTDSPVLINGESGTGKELVARALHTGSRRRVAPLIALNCATVPEDLIEAELFGHAGEQSHGLLATASGGTLFLDEIGELPASAQARLLQALEENLDVRLISATHRDLTALVANGQFRGDLLYRLNVMSLTVPPLRERDEDVLLLADAILARTAEKLGKADLEFADQARKDMLSYPWPGNVRELENAIQRAVIVCEEALISTEMLAIEPPKSASSVQTGATPDQSIEDYFVNFVITHQDNMTETELAEKLGISRKSLWERRQRLNIPRKKTRKRGRRRDVN